MEEKENTELLDIIKSSLKKLEEDIPFFRNLNVSLSSETSNLLERMNSRYTSAIEKIIRGDGSGYSDLAHIMVGVNEARLQQYQKTAKSLLKKIKKELKSTFWLRDQFLLHKIDEIENQILKIDSSSKSPTEIEKSIGLYKEQINALSGIRGSFQQERGRTRFDISLKMLLWCIPIIIGIWISGKFDNKTILVIVVIVFLSAMLSYFLIGSRRFDKAISRIRMAVIIFILILIMLILAWYLYHSLSSHIDFISILRSLSMILAMIFFFVLAYMKNIIEFLAKRNFVAVIPTIDKDFSPANIIVIPYSLENRSSNVITDVRVTILAPGLIVSKGEDILHRSISGKSAENGELTLLQVPKEAVPGEYMVELKWSFYVGSEEYDKTNRVRVIITP